MRVGFTVTGRGRQVEFQPFGSAPRGTPPVRSYQGEGGAAVLIGRLYYREERLAEVARLLSARERDECRNDDAALAWAVYRHAGRDGLERLEGDYALVVWDARAGRLVAQRDPLGGYPLFWTVRGDRFALSTSLYPLLALLPAPELDLEYVGEFLTLPGQVQELSGERCAYRGVHRLGAGCSLSIELPGLRAAWRTYWDWCERQIDPGTDRLEEVAGRYGDLLQQAVRERARGRVAAHFSGGMDSTGVALLAADALTDQPGSEPLRAISFVFERLPDLVGETEYIHTALRARPGLTFCPVVADDLLDFDSFADPPEHDEPYAGLSRLGLDRATIAAAADSGAEVLLTGLGADELLVMSPSHLADLLRTGRWGAAWAEARRWARVDNCSPWSLLRQYGLVNALPARWRGGLGALFRGGYAGWLGQNRWTLAPWLRPEFTRRHGLRRRLVEAAQRSFASGRPTALSVALSAIRARVGDVDRWAVGAPAGVAIAHPYLDPRVLCFGLGMQTRLVARPEGQKPVLAAALRGVLPEAVVRRRRKVDYSVLRYQGLARNLPRLERLVAEAPVDDLGVLDKRVLLECLRKAALGVAAGVDGLLRLDLTLALLKWLSLQEQWRRDRPAPIPLSRPGHILPAGA